MADIHLPGIGKVKKGYVIAGAAGIVVLGYVYIRSRNAAAASAASAAAASSDTSSDGSADPNAIDSTDPNAIDPTTGVPYSEEYGYGTAEDGYPASDDGGADYSGNIIGYDQYGDPIYGTGTTTTTTNSSLTTNDEWATQAEDDLATLGVATATAAAAIAKVLAGLPVTPDQQSLFTEARGLIGSDPPDGYPTPIKVTSTAGNPAPTTKPGAKLVKLPNVVGMEYGAGHNTLTRAGLKDSLSGKHTNSNYKITSQNPPGDGRNVTVGGTITLQVKA